MFITNRTLRLVLSKPSDLVTNKHVQTKIPKTLFAKNEDYEQVKFESINNNLTHGSTIGTNVPIHYHDDVLI
jgi:hypothetical protein